MKHRNVVRYLDCVIRKNWMGFLFERMSGSLQDEIKRLEKKSETMDISKVTSYSLDILAALNYLHYANKQTCHKIIHHDVRSANILISSNGRCKLSDYGISNEINAERFGVYTYGKAWLAPEIEQRKTWDERVDIFSFGTVLWEMLSTKQVDRDATPPLKITKWIINDQNKQQIVRSRLEETMLKCWKNEKKRPTSRELMQTFSEIEQQFGAILNIEKSEKVRVLEALERGDERWFEGKKVEDFLDDFGRSFSEIARSYGHISLCERFPSSGNRSVVERGNRVFQDLKKSIKEENIDMFKIIIARISGMSKDEYGRTPLHYAARGGKLKVVEILVKSGAQIDGQDFIGRTALHYAAERGKLKVVEILVKSGAQIDVQDRDGRTPLHYAAGGGKLKVVEILVKSGAQLDTQDKHGKTSLHYAAERGTLEIVEFLVKNGAQSNLPDKHGRTALYSILVIIIMLLLRCLFFDNPNFLCCFLLSKQLLGNLCNLLEITSKLACQRLNLKRKAVVSSKLCSPFKNAHLFMFFNENFSILVNK